MIFAVLGSLGGVVAFCTAVVIVARAIFRWISSTDSNTNATIQLSKDIKDLSTKFSNLDSRVLILEDHDKDRRNGARP